MGIHVGVALLRVSNKVNVEVNLNMLGKTQRKRLIQGIRTGVMRGQGVPSQIALEVRKNFDLPYAVINHGYGWTVGHKWQESDRRAVEAAIVADKLNGAGKNGYGYTFEHFRPADFAKVNWVRPGEAGEKVLTKNLGWYNDSTDAIADAIERGEVTTYTLSINHSELKG